MGSAVGFLAGVVATVVAWLVGAGTTPLIGLVLLAGAAATVGALTTLSGALVGAAQCWALYEGFVANRLGELSFTPADLRALGVVLGAGALGVAVSRLARIGSEPIAPARAEQAVAPYRRPHQVLHGGVDAGRERSVELRPMLEPAPPDLVPR